jgi:N-methylhydantoinase A
MVEIGSIMTKARLAVDIGGTFTDLVMDIDGQRHTAKVLTTNAAPERGVMEGIALIIARTGIGAADIAELIHGTTLATNAIIERKGARTALLVTAGFEDVLDIALENRFEQYDIMMDRPPPLVPRNLRFPVVERISASGQIIEPLDEAQILAIADGLESLGVESVAVGYLHSYVDPRHEERTAELLSRRRPGLRITLSGEVCPEIREYERLSTACANAYVQPLMASYLERLEDELRRIGMACPIFIITSAGGLTALETARRFPIRLVESGPAGGAILAKHIARQCGQDRVVSFDMGGTTAKICLMDGAEPHYSRAFEVARQYRFMKGSGLPVRIPVIEMVEIGAGGGSIAGVDPLGRIQVGPESAGSEPGPACYGRGGEQATVTDANLVLGRLDANEFAGGSFQLDGERALAAVRECPGRPLKLDAVGAAFGVTEIVEENMASAARMHAVERGLELHDRTMIAFGGAAPLHAGHLAEKLQISTVIVPTGAGVGSAMGFLLAPASYEVARSRHVILDDSFDPAPINAMRDLMRAEAEKFVREAYPEGVLEAHWSAEMRYQGQGHDIRVPMSGGDLTGRDGADLAAAFIEHYQERYGRSIPGLGVEAMNWTLRLASREVETQAAPASPPSRAVSPSGKRLMINPRTGQMALTSVYRRSELKAGDRLEGPAIIVEAETTTIVPESFACTINGIGYLVLSRKAVS